MRNRVIGVDCDSSENTPRKQPGQAIDSKGHSVRFAGNQHTRRSFVNRLLLGTCSFRSVARRHPRGEEGLLRDLIAEWEERVA